ncbi:MAG: RNA 2',3'-cyclic phosphodiesterase [Hyphomicrobiales bacterium]|nr:MAG: RNA 2',3'-cyclic phosphodiesterase [Hyphomicrobiales bacterium]
MPRLFTGLKIPGDLATSLSFLRGGIAGARWIEPEDYHVTLSFIGDVDEGAAQKVVTALETVRCSEFTLKITGFDSFGSKKPRALFAKIEANEALSQLQRSQDTLLRQIGISIDARKYVPHITVARTSQARRGDIAGFLSSHVGYSSPPFKINEFVLFSAKSSIGGGPYVAEETFKF